MPAEDFHFGAQVYTSDGKHVGELHRTLVNRETMELEGIVVRESRVFTGLLQSPDSMLLAADVSVPIDAVAAVTRDRVDLKLTSAQVRRLPPYLSYSSATPDLGQDLLQTVEATFNPLVPRYAETLNKPADEIEIEQGENVMLRDTGRKLGEVKDVIFDGDELVGIVIRPGGFFKQEVILPRRFLKRSDDVALFANLSEEDLKQLMPFRPEG
jgi:sporulation protein YlmC with PRC-barrel domain